MAEHLIRLRGGWLWHELGDEHASPSRVTLPLAWPPGPRRRVRLVRSFARPPVDPRRESLSLRLENVHGLCSLSLNGDTRAADVAEASCTVFLDDRVALRYELVLEVDTGRVPVAEADGPLWGQVALAIIERPDAGAVSFSSG